jgi:signal transduction histidine kinase/ActR/RegA family two-component response regulator
MLRVPAAARHARALAGFSLGFTASVVVSCALTREAQGVAAMWTANAFLVAALLVLPRRWAGACAAVCAAANVAIYQILGDPIGQSLVFTLINLAESLAAAFGARAALGSSLRLDDFKRVGRLFAMAILPSSAALAAVATAYLCLMSGKPWLVVWRDWFMSDAIGLGIALPVLLILLKGRQTADFRRSRIEAATLYAFVAASTSWVFGQMGVPLPFLVYASLTVLAFRLGPRGAVLGGALSTVIAMSLYLFVGAPGFVSGVRDPAGRMLLMQLYCMVAFYTALLTATAVAGQARMRALFVERMRVSRGARSRAIAANAAKTEFLATMSHEIRTPMNSILGFTKLVIATPGLPDDVQRRLGLIDSAGASLLTVVNDILDFSKVEAGEVELHLAPLGLARLVEDTVAIAGEPAQRKGLDLNLRTSGVTDQVYLGDEMRIRQVILNLLNNGVKFTPDGSVELAVEVCEGPHIDTVRFTVTDTGVGIPLDRRNRLFERFSQVDSSVARTYGGTGLGLAICKGLVELMDGSIGVRSAPGRGSSFWFEVPLSRCDADLEAAQAESESVSGARVLLVDDHPMNRELGSTLLTLLGCEVSLAENGADAVEAARSGAFDLILMDVHMPVMDGLAATRAIRSLPGPVARTPIIAMTADVLPEHVERCRMAGMVDHVAKPIGVEALHAALARYLGHNAPASLTRAVA